MSITINSQDKIKYCSSVIELFDTTIKNYDRVTTELKAHTDICATAATTRLYNGFANLTNITLEAISKTLKVICAPVLENIANSAALLGEQRKTAAMSAISEAEAVLSKIQEYAIVPDSELPDGLHEQYTESNQAKLKAICQDYIGIRKKMIDDLAEITNATSQEDFKDIYTHIGAGLESLANSTVDAFRKLLDQVLQMNLMIQSDIDNALAASSTIKNANVAVKANNILGGDDI